MHKLRDKKGVDPMRSLRFLPFVIVGLLVSSPAAFALVNYLAYVKGVKQGDIRGSITQKGREGGIQVLSMEHEIVSPRDPASGLPTGKRQHKQFALVVELDQSAPKLFQAMVSNETLTEVTLKGWTPSPTGTELQHFTVKLTDASIASIQLNAVTTVSGDPEKETIRLSLTYRKIEWTWTNGGITASDDWGSSNN